MDQTVSEFGVVINDSRVMLLLLPSDNCLLLCSLKINILQLCILPNFVLSKSSAISVVTLLRLLY